MKKFFFPEVSFRFSSPELQTEDAGEEENVVVVEVG